MATELSLKIYDSFDPKDKSSEIPFPINGIAIPIREYKKIGGSGTGIRAHSEIDDKLVLISDRPTTKEKIVSKGGIPISEEKSQQESSEEFGSIEPFIKKYEAEDENKFQYRSKIATFLSKNRTYNVSGKSKDLTNREIIELSFMFINKLFYEVLYPKKYEDIIEYYVRMSNTQMSPDIVRGEKSGSQTEEGEEKEGEASGLQTEEGEEKEGEASGLQTEEGEEKEGEASGLQTEEGEASGSHEIPSFVLQSGLQTEEGEGEETEGEGEETEGEGEEIEEGEGEEGEKTGEEEGEETEEEKSFEMPALTDEP